MARLTRAQQVENATERAERRARRIEYESTHAPRALEVDSAAINRRDELAAELLSYYEFLTTMYLPGDRLKRVPEGGRPNVTAERLSFLGKTDVVVDLLKHIPYISQDVVPDYQIAAEVVCNDYSGVQFERAVDAQSDIAFTEPSPEEMDDDWDRLQDLQHLATLASPGSKYGCHIMVDTRDGQLATINFMDGSCVIEDAPRQFRECLEDSFRKLDMLPVQPTDVQWTRKREKKVKDAFTKHGWPSADYQKESCVAEVAELWASD